MEHGERIASCEQQLRNLEQWRREYESDIASQLRELRDDARMTRHTLRNVQGAIELTAGLATADAARERRFYALAGLALTLVNIGVTTTLAVVFG